MLDLSPIQAFFAQPSDVVILKLFLNFGWMPAAATILWGVKELWVYYRNILWGKEQESILLAIDIPRGNEQHVKAVENLFTYFAGAHGSFNLIDKYWIGMFQLSFSFEIVSIDGYTQFIIRTPTKFRDLTESAVYSQYPDAEITEIDDYTEGMPSTFPDDEWDMWGGEFILQEKDAYPIKTYPSFADDFGRPESTFKDPMAILMDLCSSLRQGEQLWYQIIIYPTGFDWTERLDKEVGKILNEKSSAKKIWLGTILGEFWGMVGEMSRQITGSAFGDVSSEEAGDDAFKMFALKPREKKQVEAIQHKSSLLGFEVKHRFIYIAKKEVINKPKVLNGFVGYMKQFIDIDLNSLKPDMNVTGTTANYFFVNYRVNEKKRKVMSAYKRRSGTLGRKRFIMSIEELATLWHFPVEAAVKAPLIQKAPGRKAEPPMSLPVTEDLPLESNFDEVLAVNPDVQNNPLENIHNKIVENKETISAVDLRAEQSLPWEDKEENASKDTISSEKPTKKPKEKLNKKGFAPDNLPFT
ncbi:MAG: hypothetical protein U9Q85_04570 [Patescibacteria group bacterium]|nr:hypothetical protein [Patescibacteria group bacterium]